MRFFRQNAGLCLVLPLLAPTLSKPAFAQQPPAKSTENVDRAGTKTTNEPVFRTVVQSQRSTRDHEEQARLLRKTPGFATAVVIADGGPISSDGLGELLARTSGAQVRSLGGLGQYTAVGLRGSSSQQVRIFIDGVPVDDSIQGSADLSSLPIDGMSRLEIYRGYVPIAFGGSTIGGAINLVTDGKIDKRQAIARVAYGSFGTRESGIHLQSPTAYGATTFDIGYAGSDGDFRYFADNGTPANFADDSTLVRKNNSYDRLNVQATTAARRNLWQLSSRIAATAHRHGIPGTANRQASTTRQTNQRYAAQLRARRRLPQHAGAAFTFVAAASYSNRHYLDRDGQVGTGNDNQVSRGGDLYAASSIRIPTWTHAFLHAQLDSRLEIIAIDERRLPTTGIKVIASGDATRVRSSTGASLELEQRAWHDRILFVPAIRLDTIVSAFRVPPGEGEISDAGRDEVRLAASPRLGARIRLLEELLEIRGSIGRYVRPPTLMELFGDRGYLIGNEGLKLERGSELDIGLASAWNSSGGKHAITSSAAFFASHSKDLISWLPAGSVTRPENLRGGKVRGLEIAGDGSIFREALRLRVSYTYLHTENLSRDASTYLAPLPGRPLHDAYFRLESGSRRSTAPKPWSLRVYADANLISGNYLDTGKRYLVPARHFLGAGFTFTFANAVELGGKVSNALHQRSGIVDFPVAQQSRHKVALADYVGYPLPGRSYWFTVRLFAI